MGDFVVICVGVSNRPIFNANAANAANKKINLRHSPIRDIRVEEL